MNNNLGESNLNRFEDSTGTLVHYAFPGGYQMIYFNDHFTYCPECANEIINTLPIDDYERPTHGEIFYEGSPYFCDQCNVMIESEYGDPDEEEEKELTQ